MFFEVFVLFVLGNMFLIPFMVCMNYAEVCGIKKFIIFNTNIYLPRIYQRDDKKELFLFLWSLLLIFSFLDCFIYTDMSFYQEAKLAIPVLSVSYISILFCIMLLKLIFKKEGN